MSKMTIFSTTHRTMQTLPQATSLLIKCGIISICSCSILSVSQFFYANRFKVQSTMTHLSLPEAACVFLSVAFCAIARCQRQRQHTIYDSWGCTLRTSVPAASHVAQSRWTDAHTGEKSGRGFANRPVCYWKWVKIPLYHDTNRVCIVKCQPACGWR